MERKEIKLIHYIRNFKNLSGSSQAYVRRVVKSLREKSTNPNKNVIEIIKEWEYRHKPENIRIVNLEECELCGKPETIYQFRIRNRYNGNQIWSGRKCILNFYIPVYTEEGKILKEDKDKESLFRKGIKEYQDKEKSGKRKEFLDKLFEGTDCYVHPTKTGYTIKQIKFIAQVYMNKYQEFIPMDYLELFEVSIKSKRNQEELKTLRPYQWVQLSPILSKSAFSEKYGFSKEMRTKCLNHIHNNSENIDKDDEFKKILISKTKDFA